MDIETLKLLREVMRTRSFTDVANARGVAPSSISRSIAALEAELGVRLLQRSTRKLEPTEAGLQYVKHMSRVLDELDNARQVALDMSETPQGTLRISTAVNFGQEVLVPLLPTFTQLYPQLRVEVLFSDVYVDVIEERIDVALRVGSIHDSNLIARELMPMNFYICASPSYLARYGTPRQPDDLRQHDCLLFPRTGYNFNWRFRTLDGKLLEIPIQGKVLINQSLAIKKCLLAGMGISLIPDWLVSNEVHSGQLIRLFSDYAVTATDFNGAVWLLYPSRDYLPLKVKVFNQFMLEQMHQNGLKRT